MIEDGDKSWNAALHIYPLYSIEVQIHQFKQRKKKNVDINFHGAFKIKVIIDYPKGVQVWDETLKDTVTTLRQEEWIALNFNTKLKAEEHVAKLLDKYLSFKINDK